MKLTDREDLFGDDGMELPPATERGSCNAPIPGSSSRRGEGSANGNNKKHTSSIKINSESNPSSTTIIIIVDAEESYGGLCKD